MYSSQRSRCGAQQPDCQRHRELRADREAFCFFFVFFSKFKGRTALWLMFPHTHIGVKYQPVQCLATITTDDFLLTDILYKLHFLFSLSFRPTYRLVMCLYENVILWWGWADWNKPQKGEKDVWFLSVKGSLHQFYAFKCVLQVSGSTGTWEATSNSFFPHICSTTPQDL